MLEAWRGGKFLLMAIEGGSEEVPGLGSIEGLWVMAGGEAVFL